MAERPLLLVTNLAFVDTSELIHLADLDHIVTLVVQRAGSPVLRGRELANFCLFFRGDILCVNFLQNEDHLVVNVLHVPFSFFIEFH